MNKKASLALASLSLIISAEVLVSHFGFNLPLTQVFNVSLPGKASETAAVVVSSKNTAAVAANTGAVINAASCNSADVQTAINQAADGDTVMIPAGTCTWNQGVGVGEWTAWNPPAFNTKSISIIGAGMDRTKIINNNPTNANGAGGGMISFATKAGGVYRLSGMTLDNSNSGLDPYGYNRAMVGITGYSQSIRVDNMRFIIASGHAITWDGDHTYGVIDHNIFDVSGHHGVFYFYQNYWNGKSSGGGSWTDPAYWGTEKAVYVEDNVFNHNMATGGSPFVLDGWNGARAVVRNNVLNDISMGGYHGTDTSFRSARTAEIYNNTINITPSVERDLGKVQLRGGSFLVHNNKVTDPNAVAGGFGVGVWSIRNYRDFEPFGWFGKCDGTSPWDSNDSTIYDSGTHSGTNGNRVLTASGKNWTKDQWAGYYVHNITKNQQNLSWQFHSALIVSNTADTITTTAAAINRDGNTLTWNSGDSFKIIRPLACLDNRGRGKGDLIAEYPPTYQPVNARTGTSTWPNQELEPTYGWNNILNGEADKLVSHNPWMVKEGRDFFNSPLPGYTPYTYPHPLVTGVNPPPPSSYTFSVAKNGTGSGTVTSLGGGINCGTTCIATNVSGGTTATLTASPSQGSVFAGWGGACSGTGTCVVTINGNITVTATFNLETTPPPPPSDIPTVSTSSASPITSSSATLNGSITSTGGSEVTVSGFEYGPSTSYGYSRSTEGADLSGFISEVISDLSCNSTYNFRAFAQNSAGTGYGPNQTFTTGACVTSDKNAPTSPSNLQTPTVTSSQVSLKWSPSTDDTAVTGYRVHRNGTAVGNITGTQYTNSGLDPLTSYAFDVFAYDAAGNISIPASITATTLNSPTIKVGSTVKALSTLKVRSSPAILPKNVVGQQKRGATGTVTGGPVTASGYVWWQVNFASGTDGWVAAPNISAI